MTRALSRLSVAIVLAIVGFAAPLAAQEKEPKQAELPLKQVVMFNSGVGFFEHGGEVDGDARIDLKFNVEDINDLLKSMVLQDLGGGRISTVSYGSKDPITKTLKTFAVDLTTNPTLGGILTQLRGERVEVEAPNKLTGLILGVETRKKEVGRDNAVVEVELLNLLTEDGLRSVPLESVGRIKLADPKLDAELRQALHVLALGHTTDKKTVSLNFLGQGKRPVRVGYIQETPVWKTSYRLVIKDDVPPFLQGWAIVENTTEEDWNKVNLTLVSGRPISFVMDLYEPLYVARPVVQQELYASLRPQTYGQDLARKEQEFRRQASNGAPAAPPAPSAALAGGFGRPGDEQAKGNRAMDRSRGLLAEKAAADSMALQDFKSSGVQSVAQAADVGEMFQYVIATPVTLARQQSAMLPIVNESVKGEKVSIYNPSVQAKHPLNGLKLTNSTELHLMQGPITVFDGGAYAGDAKIEDLPPGSERLISYALDLDTEVAPTSKNQPQQLLSVKIIKGTLQSVHKQQRSQEYVIKNSGKRNKNVLIEYPFDSNWTLVAPKDPAEKTRDMYRFAVQAEPGKPAKLSIEEERTTSQQIGVTNLDDGTIAIYLNAKLVSEAVKTALKEVIKQKRDMQEVAQQRALLQQKITVIDQEQARIRQNMQQLDRNTDLYKRYVTKFAQQEDEVEALRGQISEKQGQEDSLRKKLDSYLISLDIS